MESTDHIIISSLPELDEQLKSTSYVSIDELRDVTIVKPEGLEIVPLVTTPFGSVPSQLGHISLTPSITSKENQGQKRIWSFDPQVGPSQKKTPMTVLLTNLCCQYSLTCEKEFNDAVKTIPEVRDFNRLYGGGLNYQRAKVAACLTAYQELPILSYEERLDLIDEGAGPEFEEALEQWRGFIDNVIGRGKFQAFLMIMMGANSKVKTIYLVGEASGGKSCIIKLLTSPYRMSEIGFAGAQAINSNFWLEDMVDKRVGVLEEILATAANIDALKMLMEGNEFSHTNIKFGKSVHLSPMPILMACNHSVTRLVQAHATAIAKRSIMVEFHKPTTHQIFYERPMMAKLIKRLFREYHYCGPVKAPEPIKCTRDLDNLLKPCYCPECIKEAEGDF